MIFKNIVSLKIANYYVVFDEFISNFAPKPKTEKNDE